MVQRWGRLAVMTLILAAVLHVAIVWLIPRVITRVFMSRLVAQVGVNHVVTPPLPTDTSRGVVMPSPDLLYAACVFDLGAAPLRITAQPPAGYWSLALYDNNSDNFFKVNDTELAGKKLELILSAGTQTEALRARFPDAIQVRAPHVGGVMLVRGLVLDHANMQAALSAQVSVRCDPVTPTK